MTAMWDRVDLADVRTELLPRRTVQLPGSGAGSPVAHCLDGQRLDVQTRALSTESKACTRWEKYSGASRRRVPARTDVTVHGVGADKRHFRVPAAQMASQTPCAMRVRGL